MITAEIGAAKEPAKQIDRSGWMVPAGIAALSLVYFVDVLIRASHKCFWFDELFTVFLCRLPTFGGTWSAVSHGADFNPPVLYLLTRLADRIFGEGLIATRLPAMVGVWIFCLCLFSFVARRAGVIAGLIAALFPFFTLVQYYAYEARAHGIVVGWCGLAVVCWQRNGEGRHKYLWLTGFGLSLLGALLTHVFAVYLLVPFAIVEAYRLFRKPNWGAIAVMAVVFSCVTVTVYLPLFRVYRKTMSAAFFAPSHDLFQRFLTNTIGPALVILFLSIVIAVAAGPLDKAEQLAYGKASIPREEILLAAGFACIPLAGIIGSKITHGPVIDRYFLSSVAGYAILLGFANASRYLGSAPAKVLAGCMVVLMAGDLAAAIYLTTKHIFVLIEPSSQMRLTTTPEQPMTLYSAILADQSGLDILVPSQLEYLHFVMYAPRAVVRRIYFVAPPDDIFYGAYERLRREASLDLRVTAYEPFFAVHNRFLLYQSDPASADEARAIAKAGYRLTGAPSDISGILYRYEK